MTMTEIASQSLRDLGILNPTSEQAFRVALTESGASSASNYFIYLMLYDNNFLSTGSVFVKAAADKDYSDIKTGFYWLVSELNTRDGANFPIDYPWWVRS